MELVGCCDKTIRSSLIRLVQNDYIKLISPHCSKTNTPAIYEATCYVQVSFNKHADNTSGKKFPRPPEKSSGAPPEKSSGKEITNKINNKKNKKEAALPYPFLKDIYEKYDKDFVEWAINKVKSKRNGVFDQSCLSLLKKILNEDLGAFKALKSDVDNNKFDANEIFTELIRIGHRNVIPEDHPLYGALKHVAENYTNGRAAISETTEFNKSMTINNIKKIMESYKCKD